MKAIDEQTGTNGQRLEILKSTSEKQIHGLKDKLETINGQTETNAQKLVSLENERIKGLEKNIEAINKKAGSSSQRLDTLENTTEQQNHGLENNA